MQDWSNLPDCAARWIRRNVAPFPFERPIFIIAPPRSGSTFLFDALSQLRGIVSLNHEADGIWWDLFPYDQQEVPSDRVTPSEMDRSSRRNLRIRKYRAAITQTTGSSLQDLGHRLGVRPIRYLDKTIANCFRVDVLRSVFPDARFILLVRDPRANISSMIEGWSHLGRFGKPQLTPIIQSIENATVDHWTYPPPPGWQEIVTRSLPEICAWSWRQHVMWALDFFEDTPPAALVNYEDLRDAPHDEVRRLASILDAEPTDALRSFLKSNPESDTTVSSPRKGKWREKNEDAIHDVLPQVRATARRIGYDI
ncbi:hypothetical protein GGP72_003051 [Salinibacter ruber]|uniref:Sulfotransferase n=2 Tax=Salinibacter ruber TaxID=146919 RepID=A0A9X2Q393_9BACT|nr:hypothetical protein [Salinibacter ruber]MCS3682390.1 hypothetical protein [Salinibacter ruber]